jgi:tetratricopeptide (TPR) repeat protein
VMGDVLFFMGNFAGAEKEYRSCDKSKNNKARIDAAISLMHLYKTQGRYDDARIQAETAMQTLKKNRGWDFDRINIGMTYYYINCGNIQEAFEAREKVIDGPTKTKLLGEMYVGAKQWFDAEKVVLEIEDAIRKYDLGEWPMYLARNDIEGPYRKRLRNALYTIKARLALENGDYEQVIANAEQAKTLYAGTNLIPADLIDILGRAYYESGDLESARDQYEWISRMTYNRKEYGDIYAKSFYMLGKIFEQMGKKKQAIRNYERFLDLWKNADPGIPEVVDARTRIYAMQ